MSNLDFSVRVRNARAQATETTIGASPTLQIFSGAKPVDCAAPDSGTLLAEMTLPADWANVSGGVLSQLGTWSDPAANAAGAAGHYRIKGTGGVCDEQGTITATGGGGVLTLDNINISVGQAVTITSWTRTEGNA